MYAVALYALARLALVADVPSNMGGMPVPPVSDVLAAMWLIMAPWQGYIVAIFGIVLAMGLIRLVLGMMG